MEGETRECSARTDVMKIHDSTPQNGSNGWGLDGKPRRGWNEEKIVKMRKTSCNPRNNQEMVRRRYKISLI